jgi:hypothetical protein
MTTRTLDWRPHPDLRSLNFRIAALDCFARGGARESSARHKSIWLNQPDNGCTGFSTAHVLATSPYQKDMTQQIAEDLYHEARRQDEWEGEDYEGSSVNGAMKAARAYMYVTRWHWCLSLAELRHALSYHGAVVAGTNWYSDMWDPGKDGFLKVSGDVVGGHAWCIDGFDDDWFHMSNSWGKEWGVDGGARIHEDDMARLLDESGHEFACPVKRV